MRKIKIIYGIIMMMGGLVGCGQMNSPLAEEKSDHTEIGKNDNEAQKERYPVPRDSVLRNYVDHRKPPKDSIDKWNAEVMAEKEKHALQADEQTKSFTIDPETGQVHGCSYIKFNGYLDNDYWVRQKSNRDSLRRKFEAIKPIFRATIMQDKEGELWYGDPKNVEIEGSSEAVHSGRGPIGFLFTDDGNNLIVPVGYPHGGMMDEIFFFDTNGNFLSKTVLDKPLNMPSVDFNTEQTFVVVSNGVSGDFYFFKPTGELFKKGNFNEITGDKGTSYSKPMISKKGKYWVLNNNLRWIFDEDGNIVIKSNLLISDIDEDKNIALCYEFTNIMNKEVKLYVLSLKGNNLVFNSNKFHLKNFSYEIIN